ncbi:hypothetical protein AGMMS49975_14900 [Clostridia bacterium]|nr:hypothetical protein AGMMS49975_14900 [Clostridia bacterium]
MTIIFNTEESRADMAREKIVEVTIGELHTFANHPFKILDDDAMQNIVESVRQYSRGYLKALANASQKESNLCI